MEKVQSMDDNSEEWVECMGVVSRRWVWLVGVGRIYGCGCKDVYIIYRYPRITYPYSSCISSFLQQHPYFLLFKKNVFRSFLLIIII